VNNVLLFIGALLVVALAALFAVPQFVDWNAYRVIFEEQAGKYVGREVRVGGRVGLRLLPAPYVSLENVRVADGEGRFSEPPLKVESFTLWLSIPPLLRGAIEASEVALRRPEMLIKLGDGTGSAKAAGAPVGLPSQITLRSLTIIDGMLRVENAANREVLRLERIDGEIGAAALDGPFRLRAIAHQGGLAREFRLTTGRLEPNGALNLDAQVRVPEQGHAYTLKGRVTGIGANPELQGELQMQPQSGPAPRAKDAKGKAAEDARLFFEVRSRVKANSVVLNLDDINILFEQSGRPQTLVGLAEVDYREEVSLRAAFQSRWLDIDRIGGTSGDEGPLAPLGRLLALARASAPNVAAAAAVLKIDQATLGGDTVNGISIGLERAGEATRLTRLDADLPGGGRINLAGVIAGSGDRLSLDGPVRLRAQTVERLIAWAAKGRAPEATKLGVQGPFGVMGQLRLAGDGLVLEAMRGEVASSPFTGEARYAWSPKRELALSIDSDRLDLREMAGSSARLADVWAGLVAKPAATAAEKKAAEKLAPGRARSRLAEFLGETEATLKLRAGSLLLDGATLRDVACDVFSAGDTLAIRDLRFQGPDGLKVDGEARLAMQDQRPRGVVSVNLEAAQPRSLEAAVGFLGVAEAEPIARRAAVLAPARLALVLTLGSRAGASADIVLDGAARDSRAFLTARLDGDPAHWRSATMDLTGTLENGDASRLLTQIMPPSGSPQIGAGAPGRLTLRANGVAQSALSTAIELETRPFEAGFSGVLALAGDRTTANGEIGIKAAEVNDGLRVAGLKGPPALRGLPVVLHSRLVKEGPRTRFEAASLRIGETGLQASGEVKAGEQGLVADIEAKAAEASLPAALVSLTGSARVAGVSPRGKEGTDATVWSDDPIDLAALGDLSGKLRLEAQRLVLGNGFEADNAVLTAALGATGLDVAIVSAEALGGRLVAKARAEKQAAGVALQVEARLDGVALDRLGAGAGGGPAAKGKAGVELSFASRGLSALGLATVMNGKGTLDLRDVRLDKLGPEALDSAAAAILANKPKREDDKLEPGALKPAITAAIARTPLVVGTRKLPFEIADGTMRLRPVQLDAPNGRVTMTGFLDLASLRIDSEWSLESTVKAEPAQPLRAASPLPGPVFGPVPRSSATLPPVVVVYAGPLAALGRLEPKVSADALERELIVRRMEKDVEELERLRLKDEIERGSDRGEAAPPPTSTGSTDRAAPSADRPEVIVVPLPIPVPQQGPAPTQGKSGAAPQATPSDGQGKAAVAAGALPPSTAPATPPASSDAAAKKPPAPQASPPASAGGNAPARKPFRPFESTTGL
jgi:hypothetical protein